MGETVLQMRQISRSCATAFMNLLNVFMMAVFAIFTHVGAAVQGFQCCSFNY